MKELQDILSTCETLKLTGKQAALATIMKTQGSTYRRAGARMLVTDTGTTIGTVSGGCLETDIAEKCKQVFASGEPIIAVYDMTTDEDAAWGLNQGCNGVIHLLLEPLKEKDSHLDFLTTCLNTRTPGAIATVFRVEGELKAYVGTRVLLNENGSVQENIQNPVLSAALLEDCQSALRDGKSRAKEYRFTEGVVEALIEAVQPPVPLFIFGGGYDAIPVSRFAKELGWEVTLVDHRPAFASKERFPSADSVILARPEEVAAKITIDRHSVAVIMTHNFGHDLELLKVLLPSSARYVGLLGPSMRTERLLKNLHHSGYTPAESELARLHAPIGIDIGADSPEEIALAILAEIQAVLTKRGGGFLKDSSSPIHSPTK
ncbi:MAG: XdhC family protein [Ignavibacteriae bacterium]|nr:XdhC family protein [Ignavibacteriota bacterium]MCI0707907.1 XdhC family protein [Ignavibacteriota bacterium]